MSDVREQQLVETVASELALLNKYNPNDVSPAEWEALRRKYMEAASRLVDAILPVLSAEQASPERVKAAHEAACDVLDRGRYGTEASYVLACVIAEKALDAAGPVVVVRDSEERLTEALSALKRIEIVTRQDERQNVHEIARRAIAKVKSGASVSPSDSEEWERRIKAVMRVLTPHLSLRCPECAGTGIRLVSNLDCYSCDDGIRRDLTAQARATAIEVLTAVSAIEGRG